MAKYTNISTGPRGIYSSTGLKTIEAGEEFDGELAKGEEPNAEWFAKSGSKDAKEAVKADEADEKK